MVNELNLGDLRYFQAIAESGHLARAAARVHRAQPALTSCVRSLEAGLGTALFESVGRGIRVTAAERRWRTVAVAICCPERQPT